DLWLFSSGTVGEDSGDPEQLERVTRPPRVQQIAADLGAHEHAVFGGMVAEDAGLIRKKMARRIPPELRDRRDWDAIDAWAQSIAAVLGARSGTLTRPQQTRGPIVPGSRPG
ncbi:MAG TPA: hypothetical protein VMA77_31910, partial [Solirubrobacteraceae bacterium]|nr:hypothetical protein [Solirubrobacteraceae bacterium]